jgi:hypothetical protein
MKTKYTEINIEKKFSQVLKKHIWWLSIIAISIIGYVTINNAMSGIRSSQEDVKKRQLGENLLRLFNYLPNADSISTAEVFLPGDAMTTFEEMLPMLDTNRRQLDEIKKLYPFLTLIPVTIIDSLQDFTHAEEAALYYRHFDYTALSMTDSLTLFPDFYKCINKNNILEFKNFQIFSYFCSIKELPYKRQVLNYRYKKVDNNKFLCEKFLIRGLN